MKKLSCLVVALALAAGCGGSNSSPNAPSANVPFSTTDLRVGTGAEARAGSNATVNYALFRYNAAGVDNKGGQIDSGTFSFAVGSSNFIQGFSMGVTGMRVGGLRRVVVPPNLAYGSTGSSNGAIRPNETLIFEIELLAVQ